MAGELLRLPIRLTNVGHMAISRIFFCTCTPEHLNFSTGSEAHRNEQLSWSSRVLSDNSYLNEVGSDQPAYLCELSPIGTANNLPVGGVLDVWLNHFTPTIEGQHTVDFLVYYESSNGAGRRHRSRHCRFSYSVLPSLKLSCRLYPSAVLAGSMDERGKYSAAHVELRNVSAATEVQTVQFHLLQIFCLSFRFKLAKVISDHSGILASSFDVNHSTIQFGLFRFSIGTLGNEVRLS